MEQDTSFFSSLQTWQLWMHLASKSLLRRDEKWGLKALGLAGSTTPIPPSHLVLTLRDRKKPYGEREYRPQKDVPSFFTRPPRLSPTLPAGRGQGWESWQSGDALTSGTRGPGSGAGPTAVTGKQNVTASRACLASPRPQPQADWKALRPREPRGPRARSPAAGSPGGCKAPFCTLTKMRSRESDVPHNEFKAFGQGAWPEARGVTEKAGLPEAPEPASPVGGAPGLATKS